MSDRTRIRIIPSGDEIWIKINQRSFRSPVAQGAFMVFWVIAFFFACAAFVLGIWLMESLTPFSALLLLAWAGFIILLLSAILTQLACSEILIVSPEAVLRRSGTALWRKTERFIRADIRALRWIEEIKGERGGPGRMGTASWPSHIKFELNGETFAIAHGVDDSEGVQIIEMLESVANP